MSSYKRLVLVDRQLIEKSVKNNQKISAIAKKLDVNPTTVYRELRVNGGRSSYSAIKAQRVANRRKVKKFPKKITKKMQNYIIRKVDQLRWSPHKIYRKATQEGIDMIPPKRIYEFIREDKNNGGTLHQRLKIGLRK